MHRRIEIQLIGADPQIGTAEGVDSVEPRQAVGWLDLLRVLADVVAADDEPSEGSG